MSKITILSFLVFAVILTGCNPYWKDRPAHLPTATETVAPLATSISTQVRGYVVKGTVNIRSCASTQCGVIGYLYEGQIVTAKCDENWCEIEGGFVYAPCLGIYLPVYDNKIKIKGVCQ